MATRERDHDAVRRVALPYERYTWFRNPWRYRAFLRDVIWTRTFRGLPARVWLLLFVVVLLGVLFEGFLAILPFDPYGTGVALVVTMGSVLILFLRDVIHEHRAVRRRFFEERRCLTCDYSLRGTCVDDDGAGTCPECGYYFNELYYVPFRERKNPR